MRKKILIIIYNIERAREHEWFIELLNGRQEYEFEFAIINKKESFMVDFLKENKIRLHFLNYSGKKQLPSLIWKLYKLIKSNHYDIVHAHLFEATLAGMLAAFAAGVKHRIVTRHYADFHHAYFPSAVKYDRLINSLSTKIIAVSRNVQNILIDRESVDPKKIVVIHHGIDLMEFDQSNISSSRIESVRGKYNILPQVPVVGVISRFIYLKGLQYIIPAFKTVLETFPDSILVLANASGSYKEEVMKLLSELDEKSYRLIEFESDIPALISTFSCFVHTPVTETAEAFGQTYIEALACEIPCVFTNSGIALEFAENGINCLLVPHKNQDSIAEAILKILNNEIDLTKMKSQGKVVVREYFNKQIKYEKLNKLYSSLA